MTRKNVHFIASASMVALAACSSNPSGGSGSGSGSGTGPGSEGNTVNASGSFDGHALVSPTGLAFASTATSAGFFGPDGGSQSQTGQLIEIVITDTPTVTCSALQSQPNSEFANANGIGLLFETDTGKVLPGSFELNSGFSAQYLALDASCKDAGGAPSASAGSVTVTSVSSTSISGTYDVTFGSHGKFTGSFDLPFCMVAAPTGKVCVQ